MATINNNGSNNSSEENPAVIYYSTTGNGEMYLQDFMDDHPDVQLLYPLGNGNFCALIDGDRGVAMYDDTHKMLGVTITGYEHNQ